MDSFFDTSMHSSHRPAVAQIRHPIIILPTFDSDFDKLIF